MMAEETTLVYLNPRQAKVWVMTQFLDSVGMFDIKLGRIIVDFDKDGLIGNVQVIQNYKPPRD